MLTSTPRGSQWWSEGQLAFGVFTGSLSGAHVFTTANDDTLLSFLVAVFAPDVAV
jgi:hypothetical protein